MDDPILDIKLDNIFGSFSVEFLLLTYKLELATAFGTTHASTSFRHNALLLMKVNGVLMGVGEAGLPPKKQNVYEADLADCNEYVLAFIDSLKALKNVQASAEDVSSLFRGLPDCYFSRFRASTDAATCGVMKPVFLLMLLALDRCPLNSCSFGRAGRSLVESTVLTACAHDCGLSLQQLMDIPTEAPAHISFYTAALNDDIALIVQAAKFGARFTPQLKIKLNGDIDRSRRILMALDAALPHAEGHYWSIDANCGWSPNVAMQMLEVLKVYAHRIYMVEQPFPVDIAEQGTGDGTGDTALSDSVALQWREVKSAYNKAGMLIFADESMRTCDDASQLAPFVNGVNIKLEKCGGFIAALRAVEEAKRHGLQVWFGCMVGSNVNSTTTAQLFPLACASDLDGALLVTPESQLFYGGFSYTQPSGNIKLFSDNYGDGENDNAFASETFISVSSDSNVPQKHRYQYGIGVAPKGPLVAKYCQQQ